MQEIEEIISIRKEVGARNNDLQSQKVADMNQSAPNVVDMNHFDVKQLADMNQLAVVGWGIGVKTEVETGLTEVGERQRETRGLTRVEVGGKAGDGSGETGGGGLTATSPPFLLSCGIPITKVVETVDREGMEEGMRVLGLEEIEVQKALHYELSVDRVINTRKIKGLSSHSHIIRVDDRSYGYVKGVAKREKVPIASAVEGILAKSRANHCPMVPEIVRGELKTCRLRVDMASRRLHSLYIAWQQGERIEVDEGLLRQVLEATEALSKEIKQVRKL